MDAVLHPLEFPLVRHVVAEILSILESFEFWEVKTVPPDANRIAKKIAKSVTSDHRYQSYVSRGYPIWLKDLISLEADNISGCLNA